MEERKGGGGGGERKHTSGTVKIQTKHPLLPFKKRLIDSVLFEKNGKGVFFHNRFDGSSTALKTKIKHERRTSLYLHQKAPELGGIKYSNKV